MNGVNIALLILGIIILVLSGITLGDIELLYGKTLTETTKTGLYIGGSIGICIGSLFLILGFVRK
jgi:hypothetical protein